jgi:hypothetical protein
MSSRAQSMSKIIFIILMSLQLGCELRTKDPANISQKGKFKTPGCLKNININVTNYLEGTSNEVEVRSLLLCVRSALDDFKFYGYGEIKGGFYATELANFLNNNFLGESKITKGLLDELMNIKLLMVGGDAKIVTKPEFDRLIELTYLIEREAVRNLPYIKIYRQLMSPPDKERVQLDTIKEADAQLTTTMYKFADLFRSSKRSYSADSLLSLIYEVRRFLRLEDSNFKYSWTPEQMTDVIFLFKRMVTGDRLGAEREIQIKDWDPLLGAISRWFIVFLEYSYLINGRDIHYGKGLDNLADIVGTSLELLKSSVRIQKNGVLKTDLIVQLAEKMDELGFLPSNVRFKESLEPVIRFVISDMFWDRVSLKNTTGMTVSTLNEIDKEWREFLRVQYEISEAERRNRAWPLNFTPLSPIGDPRLFIVRSGQERESNLVYNVGERTRINILSAITKLLIRGWSKDPQRAKNYVGLTEDEMADFYKTIKNLGQDIRLMDPRGQDVGQRIFKEANLFTWSGNGLPLNRNSTQVADLVTQRESLEQVLIIHSTGQIRDRLYNELLDICSDENAPVSPAFGERLLRRDCLLGELGRKKYELYNNLPGLMRSPEFATQDSRKELFAKALDLGPIPCSPPNWTERAQLGTITALLHYIEVLMTLYDRNGDGVLNETEVFAAFPRFYVYLLNEVTRVTGEVQSVPRLKAIFAFLLDKQRLPITEPSTIGEYADFANDRRAIFTWEKLYFDKNLNQAVVKGPELHVSRTTLFNVLSILQRVNARSVNCPSTAN